VKEFRFSVSIVSICNTHITYVAGCSHAKENNAKESNLRREVKFVSNLVLAVDKKKRDKWRKLDEENHSNLSQIITIPYSVKMVEFRRSMVLELPQKFMDTDTY